MKNSKKILLWSCAVLAAVAIAFAIFSKNGGWPKFSGDVQKNTSQNGGSPVLKNYQNDRYGYTLEYPSDWVLEASDKNSDSVNFSNPGDFTEELTVSVISSKLKKVLDGSLKTLKNGGVLGGLDAVESVMAEKDSANPLRVIYTVKGSYIFYISGRTAHFEEIVKSFRFAADK